MRKLTFVMAMCCLSFVGMAQMPAPQGYGYGAVPAPTGNEWESPENLSLNKERPRAYFFSFESTESARKVLPENSAFWQSLNGSWKFHWAPNPDERPKNFFEPEFDASQWDNLEVPSSWNIAGVQKDGSLKYGTPIYVNQPVIFQHKVAVDDWKGGVMRTPPSTWTTYKHRNEVGSYRRTFEIPKTWDGREVFINFDGVDSFFYLWVNGHYVGFSKNSRNAAAFNITQYLVKGTNVVAAEVYRSSDGSFLEAQDMFRLPGIFRTVALYSTPKVQIRDLVAIPSLDQTYTNGKLELTADVRNFNLKPAKNHQIVYSLYANKLYADENTPVAGASASVAVGTLDASGEVSAKVTMNVAAPKLWSAEEPNRYTLVAELKDAKGKTLETVSAIVGFRQVEIKDTPAENDEFGLAGRYYYVNGKTVKLKGVNRHETNPGRGHAITRDQMEREIMMMKRGNINHVRNSHYPDDPYWYFLCNKYGIYLEDEANIESHQYYYGKASLSHPKEWEAAHVARVLEMVHANINDPSIVIWSLGNEAGPGHNFVAAYDALKKVDGSRPVQYERNNDIVDMGSNQYPSIGWVRAAVRGTLDIKYPFHISEYAHSMGQACGNLIDYWDAIESTNFLCGGAIWDWIDQSMYHYTADGKRYLAYGGDFGDTPNDGQFVMNGIIFGDMEPKPQYFEVKKVYQYVGVKPVDTAKGQYEIFNKNYFTTLGDYDIRWGLYQDGKEVQSGTLAPVQLAPRTRSTITVPYQTAGLKTDAEYFVKIQFTWKQDMPWAAKGFVAAEEQIAVKAAEARPSIAELTKGGQKPVVTDESATVKQVKGTDFVIRFDMAKGTILSLVYGGQTVIAEGNGPELTALRAFTNNDNWFYSAWFERGLHNLKHQVTAATVYENAAGNLVLSFTVESQAPNGAKILGGTSSGKNSVEELTDTPFGENDFKFISNQVWTVYRDGSVELQAGITSNMPRLVLPRLGYTVKLPKQYENLTYYGRGPIDNYNDRKTGQFIEMFSNTVAGEFVNFPKPQDMGNHEDVRWAALTDGNGKGALFAATSHLSVSALHYSPMDLVYASHPHQLPEPEYTYVNLDFSVTGLGGNSCGQGGPLDYDRTYASTISSGFIIRPAGTDLRQTANVSAAGDVPLTISRSRNGLVSITSVNPDAQICFTIGSSKKVQTYSAPFMFNDGGTINAWFNENPRLRMVASFGRIEIIPLEVVYTSSQEPDYGEASNLTDGDESTIWHTMYSVTVAQYPHWVDFDAKSEKTIKGFVLLPRQEGTNGRIKDYQIQVSNDGENWGEPVVKAQFPNEAKEQRVMFAQPVKARYVRLTALSSHNGQDYATGAEFSILSE